MRPAVTARQPAVFAVSMHALVVVASMFVSAGSEAKIPDTQPLDAPPNGGIFSAQFG